MAFTETLFKKLKRNKKIPMHMPGHKRNGNGFSYLKPFAYIDITETEGFDNLNDATGILKKSMQEAADLRGADRAFYLVNGSTCGILAVISAVLSENDKVIVARNCHKSVYNGIDIVGAEPVFVYPETDNKYGISGSLNVNEIEKKIAENPDAKLIIVTSPTYEGVISDIKGICDIAHKRNIPVMVDAAHGAHLGFGGFSKDAVSLGADISIESLHKTLPSLTQTAVCYLSGNLIDKNEVAKKNAVFQTSSPSYILISSIDGCINALKSREKEIFERWESNLEQFFKDIKGLKNIEIIKSDSSRFFGFDKSKLVIFPKNQSGAELAKKLREYNIEPEMTAVTYVICMTGAGDRRKNFKKLAKALEKIDAEGGTHKETSFNVSFPKNKTVSGRQAKNSEHEFCKAENSEGRISAGYIWAYPPGVPILAIGEEISKEVVQMICEYQKNGITLSGDIKDGKILVIK